MPTLEAKLKYYILNITINHCSRRAVGDRIALFIKLVNEQKGDTLVFLATNLAAVRVQIAAEQESESKRKDESEGVARI